MKLSSLMLKGHPRMCIRQEWQKLRLEMWSSKTLALGDLVRAGWSLQADGHEQRLVKGSKPFKVGFKRNSLCAVGCINMIAKSDSDVVDNKHSSVDVSGSKDDGADSGNIESTASGASFVEFCNTVDAAESIPADESISKPTQFSDDLHGKLSINAITLQPRLEHLRPGWNKISPNLFAITTTVPEYVDTTLRPSDELMWLRTTLVKFTDG